MGKGTGKDKGEDADKGIGKGKSRGGDKCKSSGEVQIKV